MIYDKEFYFKHRKRVSKIKKKHWETHKKGTADWWVEMMWRELTRLDRDRFGRQDNPDERIDHV